MLNKTKLPRVFILALLLISSATPISAQAPQRPFPMAGRWERGAHADQILRPTNFTQAQMNQHVIDRYTAFKNSFLVRVPGGNFYFRAGGTPAESRAYVTQSEAHGYGMLMVVLMAGHDPEAKAIFDGMNRLRRAHFATNDSSLMSWVIFPENVAATGTPVLSANERRGNATDGCLDMAYALLLAHAQWPEGDAFTNVSYLDQARRIITGMRTRGMTTMPGATHRTRLWAGTQNNSNTRSSDWMPGHFRAFALAETTMSNRNFWLAAVDTVYSLLDQVSHRTTGLTPDFATGIPAVPDPRCGGASEGGLRCETFSYNACRMPWRIGQDWVQHGEPRALTQINRISSWLRTSTNGNSANIRNGYELDGTATGRSFDVAFGAPFTTAMLGNTAGGSAHQTFLNTTYDRIRSNAGGGSYGGAINILNLLLISGNWWYPTAELVGGNQGENRTPTDILLSQNNLVAPVASGARIGTLSAVDAETQAANTYTFSLVSGNGSANNALFTISGANLNATAELEANTYSVRIRVADASSTQTPNYFEKAFEITVFPPARQREPLPMAGVIDLVNWTDWETQVDPLSEVVLDTNFAEGIVGFNLDRGPQGGTIFTWAQAGAYFRAGGRFEQINYITIEYVSERPIHIIIGDSVLTANGTSHEFLLRENRGAPETITIPLTSFQQPSWLSAGSRTPINKARVSGILISAQSANSITEGEIRRLILSEEMLSVSVSPQQNARRISNISQVNVAQNIVNLNIKGETSVEIRIADVRGRQLFSENLRLNSSGLGSLNIPATIARNQALILNVRGENGVNITQRILLQ